MASPRTDGTDMFVTEDGTEVAMAQGAAGETTGGNGGNPLPGHQPPGLTANKPEDVTVSNSPLSPAGPEQQQQAEATRPTIAGFRSPTQMTAAARSSTDNVRFDIGSNIDSNVDGEKGDVMDKLAEAVLGIHKSIALLTQRIDDLGDQRRGRDADQPASSGPLRSISHKDVDKPGKYDGKAWQQWNADFKAFLARRDRRWPAILDGIDEHSENPLTHHTTQEIAEGAGIYDEALAKDFTDQLYDYLRNFTAGEALSRVLAGGREGSWEAWRVMSDRGRSRRKLEVHEEYKKLMSPGQVTLEALPKAIAEWETNLAAYSSYNPQKGIDEDMKKLILENMCPDALQEHLTEKLEQDLLPSYDAYKQVINTYLYRKLKKAKNDKKASLKMVVNGEEVENEPLEDKPFYDGDDIWDPQILALRQQAEHIHEQLNALVKGKMTKKGSPGKGGGGGGKGPGKGAGGPTGGPRPMEVDHSSKDCYECGEIGHIAANCPRRQAGGGKEHKGKGKGKGKGPGGKGGGGKGPWQPSLTNWRSWYPGPSQAQWTEWFKQGPGQAPNPYRGTANLFEQGARLSNMQPPEQYGLQTLFTQPGSMFKLVEKGVKDADAKNVKGKPPNFVDRNSFEHLEEEDDEEDNEAPVQVPERYEHNGPKRYEHSPKRYERREAPERQAFVRTQRGRATTSSGVMGAMGVPSDEPQPGETPSTVETRRDGDESNRRGRFGNKLHGIELDKDESAMECRKCGILEPSRGRLMCRGRQKCEHWEASKQISPAAPRDRKQEIPIELLIKPRSRNAQRRATPVDRPSTPIAGSPSEQFADLLNFVRKGHDGDSVDRPGLRVLREVKPPVKLAPLKDSRDRPRAPNGWEVLSAVVDSGATVTALHPEDAQAYAVEESEGSRRGVKYGTAGAEDLLNIGQKKIAVLTPEGTLRGYQSQVVEDLSSPLESVRQLVGSRHCVLFGLGENDDEHLIINKLTGEVNRMRDDGLNYMHDMLVVPQDQVADVQARIASGESPFTRQGPGR